MTTEHLAEVFESEIAFPQLASMNERSLTRCTIAWMKDSGISDAEILKAISAVKRSYVSPDILPDSLWNGSLLERGRYYYHHALQLVSHTDIVKSDGTFVHYPFYQEMKIRFTIKDLVSYFYRSMRDFVTVRNDKRAEVQFQHMLSKYADIKDIQAIDLLLFLIDEAAYQRIVITEPFALERSEMLSDIADKLKRIRDKRHSEKIDHITWRTYVVDKGEVAWLRTK